MVRVSFSSLALVSNPFDWAYGLEESGFSGWEIVCEGRQKIGEKTLPLIRDISETTHLELTLHLPFSDLNLASLNQPIWEESVRQMKNCLLRVSSFIELAVVHPGHLSPLGMQLPDLAWKQNIQGLQELSEFAGELGVQLAVENMVNMPFILGREPGEIWGMIDTVNQENFGMAWDVGHANTNGNVDEFLGDTTSIIHVHVHDNHGEKDEHLPLGRGSVDWKRVFRGLRGYRGRFVTEARTVEEGVESLGYLKKLI